MINHHMGSSKVVISQNRVEDPGNLLLEICLSWPFALFLGCVLLIWMVDLCELFCIALLGTYIYVYLLAQL